MDTLLIIKLVLGLLVLVTFIYFFCNYRYGCEKLTFKEKWQTGLSSFGATFFDTFGIGSFSSLFALRNLCGLMPEQKRYNGSIVIQAVIPTALQSILFLALVKVDILTLVVACVMIALGGIISGYLVRFISNRTILSVMFITFAITAVVLVLNQAHLLNVGGDLIQVRGMRLCLLGIIMFLAGCLPAFGVGYYSLVLVAIFLLGLSPVVAYPIMTTASAVQMPMTAIPMIKNRQFYSLSTLIMAGLGALAVFIAAPIVSMIDGYILKWVLLIILIYNMFMIYQVKHRKLDN